MWVKRLQNFGLLWLRVLMGLGIAHHGYGKIFGGKMIGFTQGVAAMGFPLPKLFAWLAASSELIGGSCIVLGLFTPLAAFFVFFTMSVAAFVKHSADPLSVKELALCYWIMAGTLIFLGAGDWSLDAHLLNIIKKKTKWFSG